LEHTPKGYSIHYIDNGVDSGPILVQDKAEFSGEETLATSYAKLRLEIENLFMNFWKEISQGRIKPRKQEGEGSMHKVKDLDKYKFLMEEKGWDTAVREIEEYGRVNKLWKNE